MDNTALSFGRWRLLPGSRRLLAGDEPIPLGSRAFDLLLARGELVTKDAPRLIATIPGRGYRFTGVVSEASPATAGPVASPAAASALGSIRPEATPPLPSSGPPMVVVLPFANMTGDPGQEHFANGVNED